MLNYKEDSKIDPNALDVEWLGHTELCRKYIEAAATARKEARWSEEEVKTIRSELILEANTYPEDACGKAKPNAADIEAFYRNHEKYKTAKEESIELQDAAQVADDMKTLMIFTRGKALQQLVELQSQAYFAGPDSPRNLNLEIKKRKELKENEIARKKKLGKKMRRAK